MGVWECQQVALLSWPQNNIQSSHHEFLEFILEIWKNGREEERERQKALWRLLKELFNSLENVLIFFHSKSELEGWYQLHVCELSM